MRRRLLAWLAAPLLSMCGAGSEINGMKFSPTLFRVDNINFDGAGGMDTSAGTKGKTEYNGDVTLCTPQADGTADCGASK